MRVPRVGAAAGLVLASIARPAPRPASGAASLRALSASAGRHAVLQLATAECTAALGARLASLAACGDVVMLRGDYGAGKTALARGFVREWYDDPDELVTSPSYLIDNVYPDDGRALIEGVAVHHMDLWRLPEGKVAQLVDLPTVYSECIALIEWPERLGAAAAPPEHLELRLQMVGDGGAPASAEEAEEAEDGPRRATLTAFGPSWEARMDALAEPL